MRTIGLDVHKRFAEVAILDQGERVVRRGERIDATASALRAFARTLGPEDQVVLEATVNTWAIADLLRERAGRVVVSNPMRTRAIADAKVKTDRIDAAVLAQLLAADFLPEVWTPDEATRGRRRQVAHRSSLLQQRTRLRNRVQAILHRNLLDCPFSDAFGKGGRRWLAEAALPTGERGQVESALRLLDALEAEVAMADTEVAEEDVGGRACAASDDDPRCRGHNCVRPRRRHRRRRSLPAPQPAGWVSGPGPSRAAVGRSSRIHRPHQPPGTGSRSRAPGRGGALRHPDPRATARLPRTDPGTPRPSDRSRGGGSQAGDPRLAPPPQWNRIPVGALWPDGRQAASPRIDGGSSSASRRLGRPRDRCRAPDPLPPVR